MVKLQVALALLLCQCTRGTIHQPPPFTYLLPPCLLGTAWRDAVYLRTFQLPHPLSSEIRPWHLSHLFICSTFWWTSLPFFSEATICRHDLTLQFKPAPMLTQSEAATHHKPLRSDLYDVLTTLRGFGSIWFKGKWTVWQNQLLNNVSYCWI